MPIDRDLLLHDLEVGLKYYKKVGGDVNSPLYQYWAGKESLAMWLMAQIKAGRLDAD